MPDAVDFPTAADIPEVTVEVPKDSYHARLIHKHPGVRVVDEVPAPTPKPKKGDK